MVVYFWLDDNAERLGIPSTVHSLMPVGYGILIPQFSSLYRKYAARLTEWENHRTADDYDRNLILKLLLFEFFNCYGLLFYVAFYKEDFVLLRSLLAGILITRQVVGQVVEAIVPWYVTKAKLVWKSSKVAAAAKLSAADAEFLMEPYELFDDYLEMVVQVQNYNFR
jgi:anoctamin-8